jgi:hypothetical protein
MTGLRRFLEPPPAAAPQPVSGGPGAAAADQERCELCDVAIPAEHGHVVNVESRALLCTCRACHLLFTRDGAAQGRFRTVPDRFRYDPEFVMTDREWDELQIPVGVAFFFRNSATGAFAAFYPSPAGATESLLPLECWAAVLAANPAFADVEADVEALLIRRGKDGFSCFLVPVDACYDLVGRVRLHWRGFDGGSQAREAIEEFFQRLTERSRRP